jgi:DNA invertase Pin-like site-specific DNA recombinase
MTDILGYARVSTGDQDVAGQTMRLTDVGAKRVFTDVMSGKSMERPGLIDLLAFAARVAPSLSSGLTASDSH